MTTTPDISSMPAEPTAREISIKLAKHITRRIIVGVVVSVAVTVIANTIVAMIETPKDED